MTDVSEELAAFVFRVVLDYLENGKSKLLCNVGN
jgi:hypothetical protein